MKKQTSKKKRVPAQNQYDHAIGGTRTEDSFDPAKEPDPDAARFGPARRLAPGSTDSSKVLMPNPRPDAGDSDDAEILVGPGPAVWRELTNNQPSTPRPTDKPDPARMEKYRK